MQWRRDWEIMCCVCSFSIHNTRRQGCCPSRKPLAEKMELGRSLHKDSAATTAPTASQGGDVALEEETESEDDKIEIDVDDVFKTMAILQLKRNSEVDQLKMEEV